MNVVALNKKVKRTKAQLEKQLEAREWFEVGSFLGNANWANFFIFLGSRETGKTVSVQRYLLNAYFKKHAKIYWLKLKENSQNKLLQNDGAKLIDPLLISEFEKKGRHIKLKRKGNDLFMVNGKNEEHKFCTIYALSTSYSVKGVSEFDATDNRPIIVVLDEFQLEKNEKRTFDVVYNLTVQLENLVRSRTNNVKVIMLGNSTEDACDILANFGFIPDKFGTFKLKSKKCVIVNMKNSEAYEKRRKGTIGDILAGNTSNYTNEIKTDTSLVTKDRLIKPQYVIKFTKDKSDWYTVWDNNIIAPYNGEIKPQIAMKRYIDNTFIPEQRDLIFELWDTRAYRFHNLMTYKKFGYELSLIKSK